MVATSDEGQVKRATIKKNLGMCEFPYHEFGSNFVGEMAWDFKSKAIKNPDVHFVCTATDVTVKKDKTIECTTSAVKNSESLKTGRGFYEKVNNPEMEEMKKKRKLMKAGLFVGVNAASVLAMGSNSCLDMVIDKHLSRFDGNPGLMELEGMIYGKGKGKKMGGDDSDSEDESDDEHGDDKKSSKGGKGGKKMKKGELDDFEDWFELGEGIVSLGQGIMNDGNTVISGYNCVTNTFDDWTYAFTTWNDPYWLQWINGNFAVTWDTQTDLWYAIQTGVDSTALLLDFIEIFLEENDQEKLEAIIGVLIEAVSTGVSAYRLTAALSL